MIQIIVGTNRTGSNSLKVAKIAEKRFAQNGVKTNIIELEHLPFNEINGSMYGDIKKLPQKIKEAIEALNTSDGFYIICPEYNGSMPGALKYFIDFWEYPKTFEERPVAFVGLGGKFGGLRPVEHLQQVFGYRNAYIFPERIFITDVWTKLTPEGLTEEVVDKLWSKQIKKFSKFVKVRELVDL